MQKWAVVAVLGMLTGCTFETGSECGREVTINPPDCLLVISSSGGNYWEVEANGTVSGPGDTELAVASEGATDVATTCATWSLGERDTCLHQPGEPDQDNWSAVLRFPATGDSTFDIEATVKNTPNAECADEVTARETVFCE